MYCNYLKDSKKTITKNFSRKSLIGVGQFRNFRSTLFLELMKKT